MSENIILPQLVDDTSRKTDIYWMSIALELANEAQKLDEVPVGAVLVQNQKIIAKGFNQPIGKQDPSAHAEIEVLRLGSQIINNYRLVETTLYVTLEPCTMCAGAMIHARIARLVFGALDPKSGAAGSVLNVLQDPRLNHQVSILGGVLAEDCGNVLKNFFRERR